LKDYKDDYINIDEYLIYKSFLKKDCSLFYAGTLYNIDMDLKYQAKRLNLIIAYDTKGVDVYSNPYIYYKYRLNVTDNLYGLKNKKNRVNFVPSKILDENNLAPVFINKFEIQGDCESLFYNVSMLNYIKDNYIKYIEKNRNSNNFYFRESLYENINNNKILFYYFYLINKKYRKNSTNVSLLLNSLNSKFNLCFLKNLKLVIVFMINDILKNFKFFKKKKKFKKFRILDYYYYYYYYFISIAYLSIKGKKLNNQINLFDYSTFFLYKRNYKSYVGLLKVYDHMFAKEEEDNFLNENVDKYELYI
jgi:hypothetical protein